MKTKRMPESECILTEEEEMAGSVSVPQPAFGRLNFNVSREVAIEVRSLASEMRISMTQVFRYAFSILKIAMEEKKKNRKFVIADQYGTRLREIVLPS